MAEILSDGTVRLVGGAAEQDARGFAVGQVTGQGWTMWWERRDW